jgi:hypothetical protein
VGRRAQSLWSNPVTVRLLLTFDPRPAVLDLNETKVCESFGMATGLFVVLANEVSEGS